MPLAGERVTVHIRGVRGNRKATTHVCAVEKENGEKDGDTRARIHGE